MTATPGEVEILLVEDNPHDAELTLRALRQVHLTNRIHVARDGAEALDFLSARGAFAARNNQQLPKVVLLDLKLPKLNGLEVLEQVRRDPRTRNVPVVVLTSSREEPDIQRAYALGVNSYIVKPVEFDAFVKAVSDAGLYWLLLNQPPMGSSGA
ncbi:MAG TPA: response regulator [Gemmatimonadales bacterium]|nr:response regulator [Gemmatimonadales bacterium]